MSIPSTQHHQQPTHPASPRSPPPRQLKRKYSDISQESSAEPSSSEQLRRASGSGNMAPTIPNPHPSSHNEMRSKSSQSSSSFADIFDSREFGSFLSRELPKMSGSNVFLSMESQSSNGEAGAATPRFLSKDLPLPKFAVDSDVFRSREAFASLFNSKEWNMDEFTRQSSQPPVDGTTDEGKGEGDKDMSEAPSSSQEQQVVPSLVSSSLRPYSHTSSLKPASVFSSRDWMPMGTLGKHVDVPLSDAIFSRAESVAGSDSEACSRLHTRAGSVSELLPAPAPVNGRTDWENMFFSQLRPPAPSSRSSSARTSVSATSTTPPAALVDVRPSLFQAVAAPTLAPTSASASAPVTNSSPSDEEPENVSPTVVMPKKKRKRAPRKKVVPEVKEYVEPAELDVLLGRGGRSNHHPGNKRYREEVKNLQSWYLGSKDKNEKTQISQTLVDYVQSYNGRFLEKDKEGWYVVPDITARRKASQALREDNDAEKRAAKRQRYLAKKRRMEEEAEAGDESS